MKILKRIFINILFLILFLFVAAAFAECVMRCLVSHKLPDRKEFVKTLVNTYGICYSSDKNKYYPIDLTDKKIRDEYEKVFGVEQLNKLSVAAPYCILYNNSRVNGYNLSQKRNIVLIGDSFTFGEGLRDEDTLGYILCKKIKKYNFPNCGQVGIDIEQIAYVFRCLIKERHDLNGIIYFYNLNDAKMPEGYCGKVNDDCYNDFENIRYNNDKSKKSVLSSSVFFNALYKRLLLAKATRSTINGYLRAYLGKENEANIEASFKMISDMNSLCKARDLKYTVVIYPFLYKDLLGEYPFTPIHEVVKKYCKAKGINCIDGIKVFEDDYSMNKYIVHPIDFHPNGKANRKMVNYLLKCDNVF